MDSHSKAAARDAKNAKAAKAFGIGEDYQPGAAFKDDYHLVKKAQRQREYEERQVGPPHSSPSRPSAMVSVACVSRVFTLHPHPPRPFASKGQKNERREDQKQIAIMIATTMLTGALIGLPPDEMIDVGSASVLIVDQDLQVRGEDATDETALPCLHQGAGKGSVTLAVTAVPRATECKRWRIDLTPSPASRSFQTSSLEQSSPRQRLLE